MYKSCFKTSCLGIVFLCTLPTILIAQSCDNSSFLENLFSGSNDADNSEQNRSYIPKERTLDAEFKYGAVFMVPKSDLDFRSVGLDVALYGRVRKFENLYLGGSFSIHQYGQHHYDTLLTPYESIKTLNSIYGVNLLAKYKAVDFKFIQAYIGVHAGLLFFATKSRAIDDLDPCEGGVSDKWMYGHTTTSGNFGATLGMQIPLDSKYDRISIDIGYQMPGLTTYVRRDDVEIAPNQINYIYSIDNLNMLTFQIGLSHYF